MTKGKITVNQQKARFIPIISQQLPHKKKITTITFTGAIIHA